MKYLNIYNKLPIPIQNIVCSAYGYKSYKQRFNKDFVEASKHLNTSETMSVYEIEKLKTQRLTEVLVTAKEHPFYKERLSYLNNADIINNPLNVLKCIPVLQKNDILNFDMNKCLDNNSTIISTSGTTGKALAICKDNESIAVQWAIWLRHRARFGIKLNDLSVNFTGKPIVPESQKKPPFWRYNAAQRQYLVSSKHINRDNISSIVSFLNSINPIFYSGYPSIISEVSRLALSEDLVLNLESQPKVIFSGAENMLENQEVVISSWINSAIITDQYGLTEGNCNFSKCEHGNYHEDFEFCHIELVNPKTQADGSIQGNLIGTAFYNKSFPLIRYDTGDIATIAPHDFQCQCGRKSQVILSVDGRKDDYILTPDGRRVMRFGYLFRDTFEALEVQIVQEKHSEVIFKTVLSGLGSIEDFERKVTELFKQYISNNMLLKFEYVENIERSSNGKFKAVLNRII